MCVLLLLKNNTELMKTLSYIVLLLSYQRFRRMFNEVINCNKNKKNQFKKRKHKTLDPSVFMN